MSDNINILCMLVTHECNFDTTATNDGTRLSIIFFFQAEDGIRDLVRSRGLGDVYKRQTELP